MSTELRIKASSLKMDDTSPTVTQTSKSKCEKTSVSSLMGSTFSSHTYSDLTKKMQRDEMEVNKEVPHAVAMDKSSLSESRTAILSKSSPSSKTAILSKSASLSDECSQERAERDVPALIQNISLEQSVPVLVSVPAIATTILSQPCIFPTSKDRIFSVSPPLFPSSLSVQQTFITDLQQKKDKGVTVFSEERTQRMSLMPECEDSSFSTKISSMSRYDALAKKVQSKKEKESKPALLSPPKKVSEECSLTGEPIFLSCVPFVDDLALVVECPMTDRVREKGPCGLLSEQMEKASEEEALFALDQFKRARRLQKFVGRGAPVRNIKYFPPNLVKQGHQIFIKNFKEKLALDPDKISRIATNKIFLGHQHKNEHLPGKCPGKGCRFTLWY